MLVAAANHQQQQQQPSPPQQQQQSSSWYKSDPSFLNVLTPEAEPEMPFDSTWSVHPDGQWILANHPAMTAQHRLQLLDLLQQNKAAFAYSAKEMIGYIGEAVSFELYDPNKRLWQPPRQFHGEELKIGDEKVKELIDAGFVVEAPTTNPHAYNLTFPLKRDAAGQWLDRRCASDMRMANSNCKPDCYRAPLPEVIFQEVAAAGTTIMSKLDCRQGFLNLRLSPQASSICTFHWRGKLYSYTRMPYGHINATAVFQKVMDKEIAAAGLAHTCKVFVDDILLYSPDVESHLRDLTKLLQHLAAVGIKLHPAKSIFGAACVPYLGHLLDAKQLSPEPAKVQGMVALPPPSNVKQLQQQMGLFNFYRGYIPHFSVIAKPLYDLLKAGAAFVWSDACDRAYNSIKQAFLKPGLAVRLPDPKQTLHLYTDWSQQGIAAILNQRDVDGNESMIGCVSRTLNAAEQNYPAYKGECLAAVYGAKAFRPYLINTHYYHHTDAKPLLWLLTAKDYLSSQAMRWALLLSEYRFTIVHRPGVHNIADAPSRQPGACAVDWTGARIDFELPTIAVPPVVFHDGTADTTVYTHEALSYELGIRMHSKGNKSGPTAGTVPMVAAAAAAFTPAEDLITTQQQTPSAMLLLCQQSGSSSSSSISQLQHDILYGLLASNDTALDPFTSDAVSLLGGGEDTIGSFSPMTWQPQQLQHSAVQWVQQAAEQQPNLTVSSSSALSGQRVGAADDYGVQRTVQLDTNSVSSTYHTAALQHGIVLYEPFGGLCSGLEACLRNGFVVKQYLYSDIDPVAQAVAAFRVRQLQQQYPLLLSPAAASHSFDTLAADVTAVNTQQLARAAARNPGVPWLVVAGFPCQDLSLAGPSKGLAGTRSQLLFQLVEIIGALQQLLPVPTAYIIENVAFQYHRDPSISQRDFEFVCQVIGQPAVLDAVQFGSLAHRVRNYWTNLCTTAQLSAAAVNIVRPPGRQLQNILLPERVPMPVAQQDRHPQYPVNFTGQQRAAWPTFMSKPGSYAFRPGQPGSLLDISDPRSPVWTEPSAAERELAMGYSAGSTALPGISELQRRQLLGQAIDANTLQGILSISLAWWQFAAASSNPFRAAQQTLLNSVTADSTASSCSSATQLSQTDVASTSVAAAGTVTPAVVSSNACSSSSCCSRTAAACLTSATLLGKSEYSPSYTQLCAMAATAEAEDAVAEQSRSSLDIWLDHPVLQALQHDSISSPLSAAERKRVLKRIKQYSWTDGQLYRNMSDGSSRLVPQPAERAALIQQCHERFGHFGVRRTAAQLLLQYWWKGLIADTQRFVSQCEHCRREQAAFVARPRELQSIPISSAGFRWHTDLAEELPVTSRGHKHVMVAIEAFSKFLVAVPLSDKTAATAAQAFGQNVLAVFGAPGMVVSDSGGAFGSEFSQMLADALIEHSHTSAYHPQANGQAEKAVHIIKASLKRIVSSKHSVDDWDIDLADLVLGYNCSPVASTKFAPYYLMFARQPCLTPAIQQQLLQPIDYDNAAAAEADLLLRRQLVQRFMPAALDNLAIAQHRDQLRYLHGKAAKEVSFAAGDFVYVKNNKVTNPLQICAKPSILQIKQVRPAGVYILQGRCGRTVSRTADQLAPCHLQLDPTIDPQLAEAVEDTVCEVCGTDDLEEQLLLCDLCSAGWHTFCLQPPLDSIPDGHWVCPYCTAAGKTAADAARAEQQRLQQQQQLQQPNIFPDAAMRRRDQAAAELHGRLISRTFKDPQTRKPRAFWGRLHFLGNEFRPRYFKAVYEDGDEQYMSTATAKKYLKPEGTQLPSGISIPEPSALAALKQQLICCLSTAAPVQQYAAFDVPLAAVELLVDFMDISMHRPLFDPLTANSSLAALLQQFGFMLTLAQPTTVHCGIIVTPAADSITACISALQRYQAAWIACYLPVALNRKQNYLVRLLSAQQGVTLLRWKQHRWIILG